MLDSSLLMSHNADIVDCLIFLESKGITNEKIIERMGCNRSTVSRWWKGNKSTPRYLAKMQKWRFELLPNTYETIKKAQEDLKYLERLSMPEFKDLLFPDALENYSELKWNLFTTDKLGFIWSCSYDKLKIIAEYIDDCRGEENEE
tara:strand:- start:4346 stop:4783 length:438 start_codon:yes stop_codon:yes gene_type:complete